MPTLCETEVNDVDDVFSVFSRTNHEVSGFNVAVDITTVVNVLNTFKLKGRGLYPFEFLTIYFAI